MLATVSSKGQIILPKAIRERLGLTPGSKLNVEIADNGTLIVKPVTTTALALSGLMRREGQRAVSVEEMNEAVQDEAVAQYKRIKP